LSHVPPDRILAGDHVDMWDHGDPSERFIPPAVRPKYPVRHRMHVSDARHATRADPQRWTLAGCQPPDAVTVAHMRAQQGRVSA
jgi:hypothetical protein